MPLAGLVLNRVASTGLPDLDAPTATAAAARLEQGARASVTAAVLRIHAERVATLARQRRLAERFTSAHRGVPVATVPALAGDVVDLVGLRQVGDAMAVTT
jgi:hypothetical protein